MEAIVEGRKSEVEGRTEALTPHASTRVGPLPEGEGKGAQQADRNVCPTQPLTPSPSPSRGEGKVSRWREISGITVENEKAMTPEERRAGIRKLKDVVEAEIRTELNAANEDVELMVERTHLWEPTLAICRKLEIGPAVLSRLMRELTGISTSQMVDKIRGEGLKEKLRENLIAFVLKNFKRPGASHAGTAVNFWGKLRAMRREAKFSYASWAIDLGFANYTRFYRACLLCFRQTPTQIEDEILREFEEWFTLALQLLARNEAKLKWTDENRKHRPPYSDGWTAALKARGDWVARMRRELELDESVKGMAGE